MTAQRGRRRRRPVRRAMLAAAAAVLAVLIVLPLLADAATAMLGARSAGGCRVVRVIDGDTIALRCQGAGLSRVRLTGFDAPEVTAPGCASELARGLAATWHLRLLLLAGGEMALRDRGTDRFGRRLAEMEVDGVPVARRMVAAGQAKPYDGGRRQPWC